MSVGGCQVGRAMRATRDGGCLDARPPLSSPRLLPDQLERLPCSNVLHAVCRSPVPPRPAAYLGPTLLWTRVSRRASARPPMCRGGRGSARAWEASCRVPLAPPTSHGVPASQRRQAAPRARARSSWGRAARRTSSQERGERGGATATSRKRCPTHAPSIARAPSLPCLPSTKLTPTQQSYSSPRPCTRIARGGAVPGDWAQTLDCASARSAWCMKRDVGG